MLGATQCWLTAGDNSLTVTLQIQDEEQLAANGNRSGRSSAAHVGRRDLRFCLATLTRRSDQSLLATFGSVLTGCAKRKGIDNIESP
ncbi:hypothetical protein [Stutzerimonas stutzeri]|uniref:hypothetical protein n=1 Tax=Stutzerimonas stutzeri TaxID=316 RepID=UPI003015217F